jgi:hypothetical protein
MARLPTRDDLPQAVPTPAGGIVRAPQNNIGSALSRLGASMAAQAAEDRKKQGVMERARATAMLQSGLIESSSNYTPQNKPDVTKWSEDFYKGSTRLREESAKLISDPNERELFMLQSEDDLTRYNVNISQNAQKIQNERHIETTTLSMDQILDAAALTENEEERIALLSKYRALSKDLVDANLMSPAKAADLDQKGRQKVAGLVVQQQIMKSPGVAYGALTGEPTENFLHKTLGKENARRDPTARPRYTKGPKKGELMSSALGLFQFTDGTWERLRKKYPELGLTKSYGKVDNPNDGRLDNEQQMRAMRALTKENAAALRKADLPVTEATLYLAHFAGAGGAAKLLSADPGARAEVLFPAEAKANPRHFVGKTVGEAIASLTKGMDGQPIKVGPEYASLSAEQKIVLERQAKAAADQQWNQNKDEFETDMLVTLADEAMSMGSREESLKYLQEADGSAEVRLKAEQLVNQRWNTNEKVEQEQRKSQWEDVYNKVIPVVDAGNREQALQIADTIKNPDDRVAMRKYILSPPQSTPPEVMAEINKLRYGDAEARQKFMELDLTQPKYLSNMTQADIERIGNEQQGMRERSKTTGKDPVWNTVENMRSNLSTSLGLNVSGAKADPNDVAVLDLITRDIQTALEDAYKMKGDTLTSQEMQQVADQAVISWYEKSNVTDGGKLWFDSEGPAAQAVSNEYKRLRDRGETLPLPTLWTKFDAAVKATEEKTGKTYERSPEAFSRWLAAQ